MHCMGATGSLIFLASPKISKIVQDLVWWVVVLVVWWWWVFSIFKFKKFLLFKTWSFKGKKYGQHNILMEEWLRRVNYLGFYWRMFLKSEWCHIKCFSVTLIPFTRERSRNNSQRNWWLLWGMKCKGGN